MTEAPPVVALFGATALGKTEVALSLAERLGADVVVADSMQVYRGLAIVTNQPDEAQRARARHHLVGFVPPQEEFTVARFASRAHDTLDELIAAGRPVIVEGGSGLYLRAALGDLEFAPRADDDLRRALEERWTRDPGDLVAELARLDPEALSRIDASNPRRVIRALEAALGREAAPRGATDRLWRRGERYAHRLVALVPDDDRAELRDRIERRVDHMLAAGALDEVRAARRDGPFSRTAMQAIGVRELCAVIDGDAGIAEAATRMKARTRALARRQLTWMRKLPSDAAVTVGERRPEEVAEIVSGLLHRQS